ncbi:MAG TPA: hypothetical protein VHG70_01560 [Nocardioidaceae bacterium]|nr:hypothetical protein [Nocardioidaceae bacterium]
MGIDLAYFAAEDDESAAGAESRPGGPLGWPTVTGRRRVGLFRKEPVVESLGPAYEGFHTRGYDPVVTLGTLESLLRGVDYDALDKDPRWGGSPSDADPPEDRAVLTITDTLRDAMSEASDDRLRRVAEPWSRTAELTQEGWQDVTVDDHVRFLQQLHELAASAHRQGHRLYCYYEV